MRGMDRGKALPDSDLTDLCDTTVIAPAFNEERALPSVLATLSPLRDAGLEVIVVDDGSTDDTALVAAQAGCRVVRLDTNQGKAGAVRAGLAEPLSGGWTMVGAASARF